MQFPVSGMIEWSGFATRMHIWDASAGLSLTL